ncbi:MAG: aminotransferase class I/II-fold pyridoxal phosphate-dependent enzyme [bacterium]|nr:aminotransferase class I/II-fold pyridoxal phosphate-dependent enzyme [bacterium]
MADGEQWGKQTIAVATYHDGKQATRPLTTPVFQTTTFQVESSEAHGRMFRAREDRIYSRFGHPTLTAVAEKVARLEGAEGALVFSSGMAAITTTLFTFLRPGDHVVSQREIFSQTFTFLDRMARSYGVETDFVDATEPARVERLIRPETRFLYIETPSNPLLKIVDIEAVAALARERNLPLLVDSTFASPYLQNPLELGASLVLHSGTKFLNGHSDVLCGVVAGSTELIEQIQETQFILGGVLDPHAAWLLMRGMRTLGVRVRQQCEQALELARFLERQPQVRRVHYPWLDSSPYVEVARRQMRGGGGVLSFELDGDLATARAFLSALQVIPIATSLGGVESLIEIPAELDFGEEELGAAAEKSGVAPHLVRLSVGIEDLDDLTADLRRGLKAAARPSR